MADELLDLIRSGKLKVGTVLYHPARRCADVIEAGTPAVGAAYNFSGATRYEQTGQIVRSLDGKWWASFCGTTFWVLNLIVFNKSSVCDVRNGDSGAPFYFKSAGSPYPQIRIRGMVVARDNNSGPNCYAMQYTRIRDLLGYSILTVP